MTAESLTLRRPQGQRHTVAKCGYPSFSQGVTFALTSAFTGLAPTFPIQTQYTSSRLGDGTTAARTRTPAACSKIENGSAAATLSSSLDKHKRIGGSTDTVQTPTVLVGLSGSEDDSDPRSGIRVSDAHDSLHIEPDPTQHASMLRTKAISTQDCSDGAVPAQTHDSLREPFKGRIALLSARGTNP